jgi:U3 small nucleolar RNA-associated protein 10
VIEKLPRPRRIYPFTPGSVMTSSLVAQLAQGASLNSFLLADRSKRKHTESYLFTEKEAKQHDLYSVHALALNGFVHLRSVDPTLRSFEETLFSDAAKTLDRTLLTKEKAEEHSLTIGRFLRLLGPYLLDLPSGKILEWLVRRFR